MPPSQGGEVGPIPITRSLHVNNSFKMKIAKFTQYGSPEVIHIEESPMPKIGDSQILVKVFATSVTVADARIRGANFPKGFSFLARLFFGLFAPNKKNQVLGAVYSGKIVEVGNDVKTFKVDDEVMGMKSATNLGTYAEYIAIEEDSAVIKKPKNLKHTEAAGLLFGGTTALYYLRDLGKVKKGEKITVIGASGAVGTNAVQIARYFGAEVFAVCGPKNLDLVKKLGAHKVIDYTKQKIDSLKESDLVLVAAPGYKTNLLLSDLKAKGRLLLVLSDLKDMIMASLPYLFRTKKEDKKILIGVAPEKKEDIQFLADLASKGIIKVAIDKEYRFNQVVEAHRLVDTGHKAGNVILLIS